MKRALLSALNLFLLGISLAHADLPAEVRADLLKDEIIGNVRSGNYAEAKQHITEYRSLGLSMPAALLVLEAKVAAKTEDWIRAKTVLEDYFNQYGKNDSGYAGALDLYKTVLAPAQKIIDLQQQKVESMARAKERVKSFENSCQNNDIAIYCDALGDIYSDRDGKAGDFHVAKDVLSAQRFYSKACHKNGYNHSCNSLGKLVAEGGYGFHISMAYGAYQQSCNLGDKLVGCHNLAHLYLNGSEEYRHEALPLLKLSCDAGHKLDCEKVKMFWN